MDGFKNLKELGYSLEQKEDLKKLFNEFLAKGLIEGRVIGKKPNGEDIIGYELVQQRPTTIM
jgi:hypothetical protein